MYKYSISLQGYVDSSIDLEANYQKLLEQFKMSVLTKACNPLVGPDPPGDNHCFNLKNIFSRMYRERVSISNMDHITELEITRAMVWHW